MKIVLEVDSDVVLQYVSGPLPWRRRASLAGREYHVTELDRQLSRCVPWRPASSSSAASSAEACLLAYSLSVLVIAPW